MNEESDYGGKLVSDLIQIVEDELDIHRWQFQLSYTKLEKRSSQGFHVSLIYDSEWCRIQFQYGIVLGIPDAPGLLTRYGRLHAPHDTSIMVWNGEKCHSWHGIRFTHLYFLDGFSPSDTMKLWRTGHVLPQVIQEFRGSELYTRLSNSKPDEGVARSGIAEENVVWNHYGMRLFELFDLRRPDLWEQYTQYLRELDSIENEERRLKGKKSITFDPPQWARC